MNKNFVPLPNTSKGIVIGRTREVRLSDPDRARFLIHEETEYSYSDKFPELYILRSPLLPPEGGENVLVLDYVGEGTVEQIEIEYKTSSWRLFNRNTEGYYDLIAEHLFLS